MLDTAAAGTAEVGGAVSVDAAAEGADSAADYVDAAAMVDDEHTIRAGVEAKVAVERLGFHTGGAAPNTRHATTASFLTASSEVVADGST